MAKFSFLLGAAAGYVLGARAGRQRYEQIAAGAGQLWRSQPVQQQVASAKHAAKTKAAPAAMDAVSNAAAAAGDKMRQSAGRISSDPQRDVASQTVPEGQDDTSADWADEGGAVNGHTQVPHSPQGA